MQTETTGNNYSTWLGRPVLLHVATAGFITVLHCVIVNVTDLIMRVRIDGLGDLDIYNEMVVAVEQGYPQRNHLPTGRT